MPFSRLAFTISVIVSSLSIIILPCIIFHTTNKSKLSACSGVISYILFTPQAGACSKIWKNNLIQTGVKDLTIHTGWHWFLEDNPSQAYNLPWLLESLGSPFLWPLSRFSGFEKPKQDKHDETIQTMVTIYCMTSFTYNYILPQQLRLRFLKSQFPSLPNQALSEITFHQSNQPLTVHLRGTNLFDILTSKSDFDPKLKELNIQRTCLLFFSSQALFSLAGQREIWTVDSDQ